MPDKSIKPSSAIPGSQLELIAAAPVHRRAFFGWCGAGTLTGVLAASLSPTTARGVTKSLLNRNQLMLHEVTHSLFVKHVGDVFQLETAPGHIVEAKLIEATLLPGSQPLKATDRRAPFSLVFRVSSDGETRQRIYPLEHPSLGRLEIFLVPVGREAGATLFQAIFN